MRSFGLCLVGILWLCAPALAETWRVEDVAGDAVSVAPHKEAEPLDAGDVVEDGAALVSGPATTVKLTRGADTLTLNADAIVDLRHEGGARAALDAKAGRVEVRTLGGPDGPLRATTRFFKIEAQVAAFSLDAEKEFATVDVLSGEIKVLDLMRGGHAFVLRAGGQFRGAAPAAAAKAAAKPKEDEAGKAADARAEAALKDLDKFAGKPGGKLSKEDKKKRSALMRKLAVAGLSATREGLQEMGEDYEGDPPVEVPRIGVLDFLFGPKAPGAGYVLSGLAAIFLGFGALTARTLGAAGFGAIGNALILLIGALAGAALHDYAFPPEAFWAYEPTPGIVTITVAAAVLLAVACALRNHLADRVVAADARRVTRAVAKTPRETFG